MAKYAIQHRDGILVSSVNSYFINYSGSFKGAMVFSSKKDAQSMADYLNKQTAKYGAKNPYSVCAKSAYKMPDFLKKSKSIPKKKGVSN